MQLLGPEPTIELYPTDSQPFRVRMYSTIPCSSYSRIPGLTERKTSRWPIAETLAACLNSVNSSGDFLTLSLASAENRLSEVSGQFLCPARQRWKASIMTAICPLGAGGTDGAQKWTFGIAANALSVSENRVFGKTASMPSSVFASFEPIR